MNWINKLSFRSMHGLFFLLMLLSVFLYKERLYADSAYYFFHTINKGWFHIEADRITIALSQIAPLIGYWIGLPLKYLMVINSIGHELFFYLLFLFLLYKLKDKSAALGLLLIHFIGQLWLFYLPFLEISYGAALAIVFYSLLKSDKWRDDKWLIALLLIEWFVLFSHPENLFLIPVLLALDYLNRGIKKRAHIPALLFFGIAILLKVINVSAYDQQKLASSIAESEESIHFSEYIMDALNVYVTYYWEVLILFIFSLIFLLIKKEGKKAILMLASVVTLLFILHNLEDLSEFYWYAEVVNSPLVFLVIFFFVFEVWQKLEGKFKSALTLVLLLVCLFRVGWTWNYGEPLRKRMVQLEKLVDYAQYLGHSKYEIHVDNFEKNYSNINWANPIEAILFSAIDGKEQTVSIASNKDLDYKQNRGKLENSSFLFRKFEIEPLSFLNSSYFQLKSEGYHPLNNAGFAIPYKELAKQIKIIPVQEGPKTLLLQAGDTTYLSVDVFNKSAVALPSALEENIYIACHWYKDDKVYEWDGMRTALELDVWNEYKQDIRLAIPSEKGTYQLQPDIVLEGKDWFGLQEKYEVVVY